MIPAVVIDPTGHTTAVEWLFVIVPVLALAGFVINLVARGEAGDARGIAVPLARMASSLRRISSMPAYAIGGIWTTQWSLLVAALGFYWDVAWHIDFGRDQQLFTAPHTLILLGLTGILGSGVLSVALATVERADTGWRLGGLRVPYAAVPLIAFGLGAVAGFPLDDIWHQNYGIDVTMWGPTHLIMIGGGALAAFAAWLLYAEAGPDVGTPRLRRDLKRALAGGLLVSLSVYQLEFDLGVPQWQALFQPLLIALACGIGMVAARVAFGRGWALIVGVNFVAARTIIALVVGPGLGHTMPRFPLYLGSALLIEAVFSLGERRKVRPLRLAVLAGAVLGTAGLATEWGFSHLWGRQPWQPSLFPGIAAAVVVAVCAAVLGCAIGRVLSHRRVGIPAPALLATGVVSAGMMLFALPRTASPAIADIRTTQVGASVPAIDRNGEVTVERSVLVDVRLNPADAADGADVFRVVAWQGGGLHIVPLQQVGPGHWAAGAAVPTGGTWKDLVYLSSRDRIEAAAVAFPLDREYRQAAVPVTPERVEAMVPASQWLMRESHGGAAWPAILAYSGLLGVFLLWMVLLAIGFGAVSRKSAGRPPQLPVLATSRSRRARCPGHQRLTARPTCHRPRDVDIGVSLPSLGPLATTDALTAVASRAERLGFGSLWVSEHLALPMDYASRYPYSGSGRATFTPQAVWLDPFLALAVAATATSRVRLGTSVLILPLRPPLLVAKAAATLDQLSGGRLVLGVGSGWLREEFEILGVPFAERGRRTTEAIATMRACWGDDPVRVDGRPPFAMSPKPVQGARLPIVCGGHSEAALRRVAACADGWQPIIDPDGFAARRTVLEQLMSEAGRAMDEVWLSVRPGREHPLTPALLERYAAAGATAVMFSPDYSRGSLDAAIEDLDRVAPLLR